jgi:hypothetical protein
MGDHRWLPQRHHWECWHCGAQTVNPIGSEATAYTECPKNSGGAVDGAGDWVVDVRRRVRGDLEHIRQEINKGAQAMTEPTDDKPMTIGEWVKLTVPLEAGTVSDMQDHVVAIGTGIRDLRGMLGAMSMVMAEAVKFQRCLDRLENLQSHLFREVRAAYKTFPERPEIDWLAGAVEWRKAIEEEIANAGEESAPKVSKE